MAHNNASRERPAPLASSFSTSPFSSTLLHPSHPFPTAIPFSVSWLRQTTLHVEHVIHGCLDALLCLGRTPIKELYKENKALPDSLKEEDLQVRPYWQRWPQAFAVNLSSATAFVLTLFFALFSLVYFTVFHSVCHVERTCRQNRTQCGTVVYLNPLMGSMGFVVLLEHWFKASSICQSNKPEARERTYTLSIISQVPVLSFWELHKITVSGSALFPPFSTRCSW